MDNADGVGPNNMIIMGDGSSGVGGSSVSGSVGGKGPLLPGMHPSSEGKRRRNRSNVEALGAGGADEDPPPSNSPPVHTGNTPLGNPSSLYSSRIPPPQPDELGPLPANWEMAYTEKGEVYFIE